ncbi:MAG: protein-L-isoaspartate O-methyltransferase [Candidatus Xenobiia bacterium LiM19]
MDQIDFTTLRKDMVARMAARNIQDTRLLEALNLTPRESFVPLELLPIAYDDTPLPIGENRVIAHPWIIAFMIQALSLKETDRVLELGTCTGYQTALISQIAGQVLTVEPSPEMALTAHLRLRSTFRNVKVYTGTPEEGFSFYAPYNAIISSLPFIKHPGHLVHQLAEKGVLIYPLIKDTHEEIIKVEKKGSSIEVKPILKMQFIPISKQPPHSEGRKPDNGETDK